MNCLSVFGHFVGLALKELMPYDTVLKKLIDIPFTVLGIMPPGKMIPGKMPPGKLPPGNTPLPPPPGKLRVLRQSFLNCFLLRLLHKDKLSKANRETIVNLTYS